MIIRIMPHFFIYNDCIYNQLLLNNLQVISRKYDRNL